MKRVKLGDLLFERGFVSSTDEAMRIIMASEVLVNDIPITKPGTLCDPKSRIRLKEKKTFVSRGGHKLAPFLKKASIDVNHRCCLDIGISTGGFTDALFRYDVNHVLGIDVGYGILDYQLRKNQKLSLLERTNAREVTKSEINKCLEKVGLSITDVSLVVMDVSFISVFKILPNLMSFLKKDTDYIILIKPQFEAERHMIESGGLITNKQYIDQILDNINKQFIELKFNTFLTAPSKIKGSKGNQEYFYHVSLKTKP